MSDACVLANLRSEALRLLFDRYHKDYIRSASEGYNHSSITTVTFCALLGAKYDSTKSVLIYNTVSALALADMRTCEAIIAALKE
jgi:hypothetical protein